MPNGDLETDGAQTVDPANWDSPSGRAFESGAGVNYRMIHATNNSSDYVSTHEGIGTNILADTQYTVSWEYGNGASGASGVGSADYTIELGTINAGVFTSLATLNQTITTTTNAEIFFGDDNEKAGNDLVFTTGGTVSGDDLSVRISIANSSIAWAGFDNVTLDAEAVPEPSSAALLGLGGLALILRRRK